MIIIIIANVMIHTYDARVKADSNLTIQYLSIASIVWAQSSSSNSLSSRRCCHINLITFR